MKIIENSSNLKFYAGTCESAQFKLENAIACYQFVCVAHHSFAPVHTCTKYTLP